MNFRTHLTNLFEGVMIALDAIRSNKARAGLTILGIAVGVLVVTVMSAAVHGINAGVSKSMAAAGPTVILVAGINGAGGIDLLVDKALGRPAGVRSALTRIFAPVVLLSGFLNNTPVVATMIPAINTWARRIGISPSKLMIPLSYSAILGGMLTLIGTSTNLVVNGQYQAMTGEPGFTLFSITAVGLPAAIAGLALMWLFFPKWLPDRKLDAVFENPREFTVEVAVAHDGPLVGKTVQQAGLRHLIRVYLVEIERDGTVVTAVEYDPADQNYEPLQENLERLRGMTDEAGRQTLSLNGNLIDPECSCCIIAPENNV